MIFIFLLLLGKVAGNQLTGPKEVKQCAGKTIHVICRYHSFYRDHVKYWCKGYYFNFCTTLLRTDQPVNANGPLAIVDNKNEGFFAIHINEAKLADNGWYWCAIERVSRHVSVSMELIIASEEALPCSLPEPTSQCSFRETTSLSVTTSQYTTLETSKTTWTTPATSSTADLTNIMHEATTDEIPFTQSLAHKIWSVMRWFLFMALCAVLFCFTMYFELRGRRD